MPKELRAKEKMRRASKNVSSIEVCVECFCITPCVLARTRTFDGVGLLAPLRKLPSSGSFLGGGLEILIFFSSLAPMVDSLLHLFPPGNLPLLDV